MHGSALHRFPLTNARSVPTNFSRTAIVNPVVDLLDLLVDVIGYAVQGACELFFRGLAGAGVGRGLLKKQPGRPGAVLFG